MEITDVGYISNIYFSAEDQQSDLRATAAAGIRGFVNLGPKVLVSPFVDLRYSWWQEQVDLRSTNESFGLQILGDLNRVQLQLQAGQVSSQRNLSSEVEVPVDLDNRRVEFGVEIDFWGPLRMFGTASESQIRYSGKAAEEQVANLNLEALEFDGELLRAGLDYEFGSSLRLGLGFERAETTFLQDPGGRSNSGSGPLLRLGFEGARLSLGVEAARKDLAFAGRQGSDRRQTSGNARLDWSFTERLSAALYSDRRLDYSGLIPDAIFDSSRVGVSLQRDSGPRTRILFFYEVGENDLASVTDDRVTRQDDLRLFGVSTELRLTPRLLVTLGYTEGRRDSSDPLFNRSLRSLVSRISLGGDLLPW